MARVTLEQVAKYAHVSRGTVDRVVNKRGNVKPEVEERVKEAIQILGYERNRIASALASSKYTRKVCIMDQTSITHYFDEKATKGIKRAEQELHDFGIEVERVIVNSADPAEYCEKMDQMVQRGFGGFALRVPYNLQVVERINYFSELGIPVVTFNTDIPESKRVCFVGQDLYQSGKIAGNIMNRLIRKGEKVIIGYGFPQYYAHHARVDGFTYEMKRAGFTEEDLITIYTNQGFNTTYAGLEQLFAKEKNIRGIYMSIEPNGACGEFLQKTKLKERPFVICHDIDPTTIAYMKKGIFDFVIDQDISVQYRQALLILRDILCFGTWNYKNVSGSHIYNAAYFE